MYKYLALAALAFLGACTTTATGQKVVDPAVLATVQAGAQAACALAPTAEAVAAIYTNNADVTSAEAAVALLCAAVVKPTAASAVSPN